MLTPDRTLNCLLARLIRYPLFAVFPPPLCHLFVSNEQAGFVPINAQSTGVK
jgi:hypothetical protein